MCGRVRKKFELFCGRRREASETASPSSWMSHALMTMRGFWAGSSHRKVASSSEWELTATQPPV